MSSGSWRRQNLRQRQNQSRPHCRSTDHRDNPPPYNTHIHPAPVILSENFTACLHPPGDAHTKGKIIPSSNCNLSHGSFIKPCQPGTHQSIQSLVGSPIPAGNYHRFVSFASSLLGQLSSMPRTFGQNQFVIQAIFLIIPVPSMEWNVQQIPDQK